MTTWLRPAHLLLTALAIAPAPAAAHDGPPYPVVSDRVAGPYLVSVWTDPDTTDDRSPGGQFWVMLAREDGDPVPAETRATIVVRPIDRAGDPQSATAEPVRGDPSTQFGAVVLDHEGQFAVSVEIAGPLGAGQVDSEVAATYDLRPPAIMLALYLMPFLVVGILWTKLLLRRRQAGAAASGGRRADARDRRS